MRQITIFLFIISLSITSCLSASAMSRSKIRSNAHFLTDRMAHELRLTRGQYDDIYEINYDFIYDVRYVVDDAMRGYSWALDRYYESLDDRNDDLRYVLSYEQYRRFLRMEYFYRPICSHHGKWEFRVYIKYHNHSHFYYHRPHHYKSYSGGHCRKSRGDRDYYRNRYNHKTYTSNDYRTSRGDSYRSSRRADFGVTETRPGSERSTRDRRSSSSSSSSSSRGSSERSSSSSRDNSTRNSSRRSSSSVSSTSSKATKTEKTSDNDQSSSNSRRSSSSSRRSSSDD